MDEARYRDVVELVRRVRHDVNSPLTAALGNLQLLLEEDVARAPEVREQLKVIEREIMRIMDILAELRTVGLEAGPDDDAG